MWSGHCGAPTRSGGMTFLRIVIALQLQVDHDLFRKPAPTPDPSPGQAFSGSCFGGSIIGTPDERDRLPEESVLHRMLQDTDIGVARGILIVCRWNVRAERRRPSELCP
jgi:hypothetical protein